MDSTLGEQTSQLYAVPTTLLSGVCVCVDGYFRDLQVNACSSCRLLSLCALAVPAVALSILQLLELGRQCFLRMCILKTINFVRFILCV